MLVWARALVLLILLLLIYSSVLFSVWLSFFFGGFFGIIYPVIFFLTCQRLAQAPAAGRFFSSKQSTRGFAQRSYCDFPSSYNTT
jgi:fucose permease